MRDETLAEIIVRAERELNQSAGLSVQVYAQDTLKQKILDAFVVFFDDLTVTWKRFVGSTTYTLDGTTGHVTSNAVQDTYRQYDHITSVFPATSTYPLTSAPQNQNNTLISGDTPLYIQHGSTDVLKVLPITATGQIVVNGKQFPAGFPYNPGDTVPFDALALAYYAAWEYAVDDGTNAAGAEKLRAKFENRYRQLKLNQSQEPIALNGRAREIPTGWRDE